MYDTKECNQFVADMERAGFKVRHYKGRFSWQGPAVVAGRDRLMEVQKATSVVLQMDNMARDLVIYPKIAGRRIDAPSQAPHKSGQRR
ncbi:MAG: hypothetical protein ACLPX9_05905 [Rhodomicrobium sp.]